jgi:hypothetical protein
VNSVEVGGWGLDKELDEWRMLQGIEEAGVRMAKHGLMKV